ncbi:MAG: ornithine cyclodeaminase family protein [Armatimonadetes bacterium]|nr:ornithine cyclodeaminase family protein [Armatimonadota bacterium]MDW8121978.1 ornithine cyclodeaminase family protein [Armatimonadota bacterium]
MALFLSEKDVTELLDIPTAVEAVKEVMALHGLGQAVNCPRQRIRRNGRLLHWMAATVAQWGLTGFKVYTDRSALFFLYDFDGALVAVMEAARLGQVRTGAASAVASQWMARRDSQRLAVIGAGFQAETQVLALDFVFKFQEIWVTSRSEERRSTFCQRMATMIGDRIFPTGKIEEMVGKAAIVVTVTTSSQPVLLGKWLSAGTHINAVGANSLLRRELDREAVDRCQRVVVDDRVQTQQECGDLLASVESGRLSWGNLIQLGQVVAGQVAGRESPDEITLFDSHGIALWDLAVGKRVWERARESQRGLRLPF